MANSAPVASGVAILPFSTEDTTDPAGASVLSVFAGSFADVDGNTLAGVAITGNATFSQGAWQYFDGTWVNVGTVLSEGAALVLASDTLIRFLPASNYNGAPPPLTAYLIDDSAGAVTTGSILNVSANGGQTRFSDASIPLITGVTAVNDAPVFVGSPVVSLPTIGEDQSPGVGATILSLFNSHFSDLKDQVPGGSSVNAFSGVAVLQNSATAVQGAYQYFAGGTWQDLPAVSTSNALMLDTNTLIRFVPATDYFGTVPPLIVSMADDSAGAVTSGTTADLSVTGGSTPFSLPFLLNIVVTPANDAPVPTGVASLAAVTEDTAAPGGQTVSTMFGSHFSDVDGNSLAGVAITSNPTTSQGVWQYFNGAWLAMNAPSEGASLVLASGALVRFLPAANFNGAPPALTAYLIDSSGGAVTTGSNLNVSVNGGDSRFSDTGIALTTSITAVNDTPVVPVSATTVGATEQTPATLLGSITVSDVELTARNGGFGDYGGASFTAQRTLANAADSYSFGASGLFAASGGNLQAGGLTFATFNSAGGVLTINFTSSAVTATTTLVNDVLRHITYTNISDAPPSGIVLNYTLNDGSPGGGQGVGGSATSSGSVQVNITGVNDTHTGGVSITGTLAEDQVLTANTSTLADADGIGTIHYQWQRNVGVGFVNVGADQSTYTLGDGDIGGIVRVVSYYTDAGGSVESATSAATSAIIATNDAPTGSVTITGTATENQVLTANTATLADSDGLGSLHYQWQRNTGSGFVSIGAPDQATYTLGDADVGGLVRVVTSYTDGQGFANSVTSAGSATIAGINDPHTGGVSITGTVTEDQVLTANTTTLVDVDGLGTLHYQWQHDVGSGYVNIGTDQSTYALGNTDVGGVVRVVIAYTDQQGFVESATSAGTAAIANVNDVPTGGVTVTGVTTENQVLTVSTAALADADGLGTLHYQWQRDGGSGFVNVGTDQATYTLGDADVGKIIRVVTAYIDQQGTTEAVTSTSTAAIAGINDPHTGGAAISGTTTEDQVLSATSTFVDIDGLGALHYQWQHNIGSGYVNVGTDQSTYTLSDADVGGVVRVVVSYTDGQGFAEAATSASTAAIANINDVHTGGVSISGTAAEDQVLTADTSTLADADGLGTLHYQWQRNSGSGFTNVGTDQVTYTLGDADIGATVRVVMSYIDQQGTAEAVTSAGTAAIAMTNDAPTGAVTITGAATENQVLTAVSTLADSDGLGTLHYDWQRDTGAGFVSIGAADQASYALDDADVGKVLRVVTSYTDGQGFANSVTSAGSATITAINDPYAGGASIMGNATEDQTLTADTSTLADGDGLGTLHYQWQHDVGAGYVNIGADQATYTLSDADVGGAVRVIVSYIDGQGFAESATSASTAAIANINDAPTGPVAGVLPAETEDQVFTLTAAALLQGFSDADAGDTLIVDAISSDHATVTSDVGGTSYTITPDANFNGTLSLAYTVSDGHPDGSIAVTRTVELAAFNDLPTDITLSANAISENSAAGTIVGIVSGTDPDDGDVLSFLLASNPDGVFAIDGDGQIVLASGKSLDFETRSSYEISVIATDQGGAMFEEAFTIDVTDIKEPITGSPKSETLHGGNDADIILGLDGNDTLDGRGAGDRLNGGKGSDTATYASSKAGVLVNLSKPLNNTGEAAGDSFISIENLAGSKFKDTLVGSKKDNDLDGRKGNDALTGGGGSDQFIFGSKYGNDTITDFHATGNGHDLIDLSNAAGISGFKNLANNHIKDTGDDLLITTSDGSALLLKHIGNVDDLSEADFVF